MSAWRALSEWCDRVQAHPGFLLGFNAAWTVLLGWSLDASNLLISVLTANAVLLTATTVRVRDGAIQAKLDELIAATADARDTLIRAEEQDARAIGELRR